MAQLNSLLVTGDSRFLNPINGNARNGIYYVKGTQTAATGAWTGNIPVPALYDGLTICYYLPYAGSGNATLNLTLSNGTTTGAINCYYQGNSRLTTHYGAGSSIMMTYHPAGSVAVAGTATTDNRWVVAADYDSNSDQNALYIRYYNNVLAKTALTAEKLIVGDTDGYNIAAGGTQFNISFPILWTTAAVSAGASNYANMYIQTYDRNLTNVKSGFSSTANKAIYMPVTLSGNIATIDSVLLTDTLPNSDDGKVYIRLGRLGANSTGANRFFFEPVHPMFWYKNGAIRQFAQDASTVCGKALPTSASSATTGISIADHTTGSITGVQASTTTASKVTLGTAISVPNVTNVSDVTVPIKNTSATSIPNVTAVGSGSFTATVTNGVLSFSHTHTAPTLGTAISLTGVQATTTTASKVTLGTAISVPNVTGATDVTVPIKNTSATTVVTGKTHTITDSGHTHNLS